VQPAIASVHVTSPSFAETDWSRIVSPYAGLFEAEPSPIVNPSCVIAKGMRDEVDVGLAHVDAPVAAQSLPYYAVTLAARGLHADSGVEVTPARPMTAPQPVRAVN
jgi:RNA polymerase sigma-70 factor, ECF subfamily